MPAAQTTVPAPTRAKALEQTLTYRLHLLHKLTDHESQLAYPQETGLSLATGRCLAAVGAFEPLSVKALAARANLNKGQASRAAQALVDQGLVAKCNSTLDGRGVVLTLTETGQRTWRRTMDLIETRNQQIFGCLSDADQTVLSKLLDQLIVHAQRR